MATSKDTILNFWIVNRTNALTPASFLDETIKHCRNVLGYARIVVFMDNARIHSTQLMKNLAHNQRVYFLLNAPISSKINQVEYVFEMIKRTFRLRRSKTKGQSLAKDVRDRLKDVQYDNIDFATRRTRKHILRSILNFDMWTQWI